jgi:hypothetical protein
MTKVEILQAVLSDYEWHSTEELVQSVGHRFSATIHVAVRQYGFEIEKRRSSDRQFEYRRLNNRCSDRSISMKKARGSPQPSVPYRDSL